MGAISDWLERWGLYIALLTAWIAMLGSLYLSEIAGYIPCTLCWYQRILMYPLAGIIAIGLLRRDRGLPIYVLPFSVLGIGFSTYHYLLQKTDLFSEATACKMGVPCTSIWINWFGFATIPFLALAAFTIITVVALIVLQAAPAEDEAENREKDDKEKDDEDSAAGSEADARAPWIPVFATIGAVILAFALLMVVGREEVVEATPPSSVQPSTGPIVATIDGGLLYQQACGACHGADLAGIQGLGNALAPSPFVDEQSDAELLAFIRAGRNLDDPANTSGLVMPESGGRPDLNDTEMLAIIAHIRAKSESTQ